MWVLRLDQPWASRLMSSGHNMVMLPSGHLPPRGSTDKTVAIYANSLTDLDIHPSLEQEMIDRYGTHWRNDVPYDAFLGTARLCTPIFYFEEKPTLHKDYILDVPLRHSRLAAPQICGWPVERMYSYEEPMIIDRWEGIEFLDWNNGQTVIHCPDWEIEGRRPRKITAWDRFTRWIGRK